MLILYYHYLIIVLKCWYTTATETQQHARRHVHILKIIFKKIVINEAVTEVLLWIIIVRVCGLQRPWALLPDVMSTKLTPVIEHCYLLCCCSLLFIWNVEKWGNAWAKTRPKEKEYFFKVICRMYVPELAWEQLLCNRRVLFSAHVRWCQTPARPPLRVFLLWPVWGKTTQNVL